jgi:bacteriocin-like protein
MPKISKNQPQRGKPEALVKAGKKAQIELTESDLKKVSGGLKIDTYK